MQGPSYHSCHSVLHLNLGQVRRPRAVRLFHGPILRAIQILEHVVWTGMWSSLHGCSCVSHLTQFNVGIWQPKQVHWLIAVDCYPITAQWETEEEISWFNVFAYFLFLISDLRVSTRGIASLFISFSYLC